MQTIKELLKHETKKSVFRRFLIILTIVLLYFIYTSIKFNGLHHGFFITILTWSFFVFCTPIADAGFLLDFPLRLFTKIRMTYLEIAVWVFAATINVLALIFNPQVYNKTFLLRLFHNILTQPFPFWSIIVISAIGTFFSVMFGDELFDVAMHKERVKFQKHKKKHHIIIFIFIIVATILLYSLLIKELGLSIPKETDIGNNDSNFAIINSSKAINSSKEKIIAGCELLWWFDDMNTKCQQKKFCGLFMYKGLRTFKTKEECEKALEEKNKTKI